MAKNRQTNTAAAPASIEAVGADQDQSGIAPSDPLSSTTCATVQAFVLSDCAYGKWGDVIEVDAAVAASCLQLDPAPGAVAYGLTLPQNQPSPDVA